MNYMFMLLLGLLLLLLTDDDGHFDNHFAIILPTN